jgi:hypothetical protein
VGTQETLQPLRNLHKTISLSLSELSALLYMWDRFDIFDIFYSSEGSSLAFALRFAGAFQLTILLVLQEIKRAGSRRVDL